MRHETSSLLHDYWMRQQAEGGVRAAGIRALELAPILPSLFLIDFDLADAERFRFRFCGAEIAFRYGRDLTDESFLDLWNPQDRAVLKRDLRASAIRTSGMVVGVVTETLGGGHIAYEMLVLPLAGDRGAAGAIGCMARIGGHEERNRIRARVIAQTLRSTRFLANAGPIRVRLSPQPEVRLARMPPPGGRRYGHLTLLPGGK